MSGFEKLGFKGKLGFGKHKGDSVHTVFHDKKDVGWLLWIRKEKHKQGTQMFDDAVNNALDQQIAKHRKEWGKFAIGDLPGGKAIPGLTTQPDRSEEYNESWGAF